MRGRDPGPPEPLSTDSPFEKPPLEEIEAPLFGKRKRPSPEPLSAEREAEIRRDARGKLWSKHGGNERGYPTHRRALRDLLTEIDRLRAKLAELETFADGMTDLQNERVDEIMNLRAEVERQVTYLQARAANDKNLAALRAEAEVERLTNEGIDSDAAEAMEQTWRAKYAAARADADRLAEALRVALDMSNPALEHAQNFAEALRLHEEGSSE